MNLLICVCLASVLTVVFAVIHLFLKRRIAYRIALQLPGAPMLPVLGNTFQIAFLSPESSFRYFRTCARLYAKSHRLWFFGVLHFNAIRASDLENLLSSSKNITKSELYNFLHPLMGTGLLTSTGIKWFQRRRILTPAFHFSILEDFLKIFREESAELVTQLQSAKHLHSTVLQDIIARFTLNTICESAMGVKIDSMKEPDAYRRNLYKMGEWLVYRCMNPCLHANAIYNLTGIPFILKKYLKPVHSFSWGVIDRRRKAFQDNSVVGDSVQVELENEENVYFNKKKRYAMLDTLFAAESNNNQIDYEGIREEVDTFMFEGYDTTSSAIMFCLFMMAHHGEEQAKLYAEVISQLGDRTCNELTTQDYSALDYMDRFIKETLRLYPSVPYMGRELTEALDIGELLLPIGTQIHIHTFDLHRDPEQFPNPELFDPDRFLTENKARRHPFAYIAFSAGPRNCIGQKFAMLEIKCLLAFIITHFKIEPITPVAEVVFVADVILRPKNRIVVKFTPRNEDGRPDSQNEMFV